MLLQLVFCGSSTFAAEILQSLLDNPELSLARVITRPARPAGRGHKITPTPVHEIANKKNIPVSCPENARMIDKNWLCQADLMLVAAYGIILPRTLLEEPTYGSINVHASLLPRWRGASPIQYALLNGDKKTGISIIQMNENLDAGSVLDCASCPIHPNDTAGALEKRLVRVAIKMLPKTMAKISRHALSPQLQDEEGVCFAPVIKKWHAELEWQQSAVQLSRMVRAFNPEPVAFGKINGQTMRVWQASAIATPAEKMPGSILRADKTGILVATGDGVLSLEKIQLPGKKVQTSEEIVNGRALFLLSTP